MAVPTQEELQAALKVVEAFDESLNNSEAVLLNFANAYSKIEQASKQAAGEINRLQELAKTADDQEKERLLQKIERTENYQKFLSDNGTKVTAALEKQSNAYYKFADDLNKKSQDSGRKFLADAEKMQGTFGGLARGAANVGATTAQAVQAQVDLISTGLRNLPETVAGMAIKSLLGVGPALADVSAKTKTMGTEVEAANLSFAKLGLINPKLAEFQRYALDTRNATSQLGTDFERFGGLVSYSGLDITKVNKAMLALVKGSPEFRQALETDPEAVVALTNYGATLEQLGVTNENFTKQVDFLTRVKKDDIETSLKTTLTHTKMAKQLGIDANTIFSNFDKVGDTIAAFGADGVDVFQDLQVVSARTGIEMGRLDQSMQKFDTFSGATEMAQKFNAVLRDTGVRISPEVLFKMDPAEKVRYLGEKLKESGVFAAGAGKEARFLARGLADMSGISVPDLRRMADPEALSMSADALDRNAMSAANLGKQVRGSLTSAELNTAGLQGMTEGTSKLVDQQRALAEQYRGTYVGTIEAARDQVGDVGATLAMAGATQTAAALSVPNLLKSLEDIPGLGRIIQAGLAGVPMVAAAAGGIAQTPGGALAPQQTVSDLPQVAASRREAQLDMLGVTLEAIKKQSKAQTGAIQELIEQNKGGMKIEGTLDVKNNRLTGKAKL